MLSPGALRGCAHLMRMVVIMVVIITGSGHAHIHRVHKGTSLLSWQSSQQQQQQLSRPTTIRSTMAKQVDRWNLSAKSLVHLRHMITLLKSDTPHREELMASMMNKDYEGRRPLHYNARTLRRTPDGGGDDDNHGEVTAHPTEFVTHRTRHRRYETTTLPDLVETTFPPTKQVPDDVEHYTEFRDQARFWVQRVLVPLLMVVGVLGNSITIAIMTRRRMRSSTNWYLTALATFDMLYLITTFLLSLKHYPNAHHSDYFWYWYAVPWAMMLADTSSNTSVWLTVTFTIERYIAVCHPIKGKVICTESRAKKVCIGVFLICFSVTLPTPFEWKVVAKPEPTTNATTYSATFSDLGNNETYKNIYYHLNVLLFTLIPLTLLTIFNVFLIRSVNMANKQRERMMAANDNYHKSKPTRDSVRANNSTTGTTSQSSKQETRITIMLIFVVILFIICQTPTACMLIFTAFEQDMSPSTINLITGLSNIFNLLLSINSAGNFVLYCLLSQKYRTTFMTMFCPCLTPRCIHNKNGNHRAAGGQGKQRHFSRGCLDQSPSITERTIVALEPSATVAGQTTTTTTLTTSPSNSYHLNTRPVNRHSPTTVTSMLRSSHQQSLNGVKASKQQMAAKCNSEVPTAPLKHSTTEEVIPEATLLATPESNNNNSSEDTSSS